MTTHPSKRGPTDTQLAIAQERRRTQRVLLDACTCMYPMRTERTGSGHPKSCPAHELWVKLRAEAKAKQAQSGMFSGHNHVTRDVKRPGVCPGCDDYHRATGRLDDRPGAAGERRDIDDNTSTSATVTSRDEIESLDRAAARLKRIVGPMWSESYCRDVAGRIFGES